MPFRDYIQVIVNFEPKTYRATFPSLGSLKRYIKIPLMVCTLAAGLSSGMASLCAKIIGELIEAREAVTYLTLLIICGIFAIIFALGIAYQMNCAMLFYQQIEVMPLYQASMALGWTVAGTMVLREMEESSGMQKVSIVIGLAFMTLGAWVLAKKHKIEKDPDPTEDKVNKAEVELKEFEA